MVNINSTLVTSSQAYFSISNEVYNCYCFHVDVDNSASDIIDD